MDKVIGNVKIENAKIIFRNFSGKPDNYDKKGHRSFCVIIEDEDVAKEMIEEGWNVRILAPRDEEEQPKYYINVAINYDGYRPPNIYMISNGNKVLLEEDYIGNLDYAEFETADVIFRPYEWEVQGKTGIKAYLKTLYVVLVNDELDKKYEKYGKDESQTPNFSSVAEDDLPF